MKKNLKKFQTTKSSNFIGHITFFLHTTYTKKSLFNTLFVYIYIYIYISIYIGIILKYTNPD